MLCIVCCVLHSVYCVLCVVLFVLCSVYCVVCVSSCVVFSVYCYVATFHKCVHSLISAVGNINMHSHQFGQLYKTYLPRSKAVLETALLKLLKNV